MRVKILIADDERMLRLSLISMLEELFPGEHMCVQAKNGRELLALAAEQQPDIAFVDIRMPLLDGLGALRELHTVSPQTQAVILSGYSSFEYAQAAVGLNVQEYLLKPVSTETLQKSVETARRRIADRQGAAGRQFAHAAAAAWNRPPEQMEYSTEMGGRLTLLLLMTSDWATGAAQYRKLVRGDLTGRLSQGLMYALLHTDSGDTAIVVKGDPTGLRARLQELAGSALSGVALPIQSLAALSAARLQCERAVAVRSCVQFGKIMVLNDATIRQAERFAPLSGALCELCTAFRDRQALDYKNVLNRIYRCEACRALWQQAEPASLRGFLQARLGEGAVDTGDYRAFVRSLMDFADRIYQTSDTVPNDPIEKAKAYIRQHYMADLGIGCMAELLGISPNYFSRIFSERENTTFIRYLTEVRIENAKRLLKSRPQLTVQQVAQQVGYSSVRHFTKTFTKVVGRLPSAYQNGEKTAAEQV